MVAEQYSEYRTGDDVSFGYETDSGGIGSVEGRIISFSRNDNRIHVKDGGRMVPVSVDNILVKLGCCVAQLVPSPLNVPVSTKLGIFSIKKNSFNLFFLNNPCS